MSGDIQFNEDCKDYPIDHCIDDYIKNVCLNNPYKRVWFPKGKGKTYMLFNPMRGWFGPNGKLKHEQPR